MFDSFLITYALYGIHVLSMLFVFMYVHCCPWRITSDDIRACRLAVTRRVSLVEQELFTILVHLSSPPSYSGVLAAQSLVFSLVLVEQELLTILVLLSSPPSYSGVLAAQTLVFCLVLYLIFFVFLSLSFRPLYCLSFLNLWLLITTLVSSNFSYIISSTLQNSSTLICVNMATNQDLRYKYVENLPGSIFLFTSRYFTFRFQ